MRLPLDVDAGVDVNDVSVVERPDQQRTACWLSGWVTQGPTSSMGLGGSASSAEAVRDCTDSLFQ